MHLTNLRTFKLSVPTGQSVRDPRSGELLSSAKKSWLLLKLETDAGITGWGEGSGEWLVPAVEAAILDWKPLLIGSDPLPVSALTDDIVVRLPWRGGPVFGSAVAAINMALYDIAGQAWQAPVHTLLGGKRRQRIRVYAGGAVFTSPEEAVRVALDLQRRGYAGVKGNPLEGRTWPMDYASVTASVACVAAVRKAVGDGFEILLDTHGSPLPELSLELARQTAPYRPLFLEEPVKAGSVDALLEVARRSPVPIATGEKLFGFDQFHPLIERRACSFLQPDLAHCFGLTAFMEIAAAGRRQQMLMAPHMTGGPVHYAATLAADSAIENFLIQETNYFDLYGKLAEHDWKIENGTLNIPDRPGLGVAVKEVDLARFPYEPMPFRQYRHSDGSWKGW